MASVTPPVCNFGWQAPNFNLQNIDLRMVSRDQIMGENGLLVMFIGDVTGVLLVMAGFRALSRRILRLKTPL